MNEQRSYSQLLRFPTFEERYRYLKLDASVGNVTFGYDRYLNQQLYQSRRWHRTREQIAVRDHGRDLAVVGFEIRGRIVVHHMNVIRPEDIENESDCIFDPENLITVSHRTHLAIHYGDEGQLAEVPVERRPGDTAPWRMPK